MQDMLGRRRAVTPDEARRIISEHLTASPPPEEEARLEKSHKRVLSRDVVSPEDLPGFDRSTMDGYAVNARDTFGATEAMPLYLSVAHEVKMGEEPAFRLGRGEAARISTGGMIPRGADSVLMLEHAQPLGEDSIEAQRAVAPGENVIRRGEDAARGELLLMAGHRLRAQDVAVLSGLGIASLYVYKRPRVSIISTGDEVVAHDAPLRPGFIRDMNSLNLSCLVESDGCVPILRGIYKDDYAVLRDAVGASLRESDVVLVSGGSSVGLRDVTARTIEDSGPPGVVFHGVSVKPGKPLIAGFSGGKPLFGLPGHPAAAAVCYEVFIRPVVGRLSGLKGGYATGRTVEATLTRSVSSSPGREEYVRVSLKESEGRLFATPVLGKSGLITTLVRADGTIKIPMGRAGAAEGENVEVFLVQ